jgi:dCMP deaminase
MHTKHIMLRIKQAEVLAAASNCPRGKVGAVIISPDNSNILADGYNGGPRRSEGKLCGGPDCIRDRLGVVSGTEIQIGCHHAEMNALCNALRQGASTLGAHMICTTAPCLMCAKLIHHSGIEKLYYKGQYSTNEGLEYLIKNNIECTSVD